MIKGNYYVVNSRKATIQEETIWQLRTELYGYTEVGKKTSWNCSLATSLPFLLFLFMKLCGSIIHIKCALVCH